MNPADPNLALLELIAEALGPLRERFVFVGTDLSLDRGDQPAGCHANR